MLGIGNSRPGGSGGGGGGGDGTTVLNGAQAINHLSGALPLVVVDLTGLALASAPAFILARVEAPNSTVDVFDCTLIAGWTATSFTVRLHGQPEVADYYIVYLLLPGAVA